MSVAPTTRRHDLDWLRVIAFLILILYHTGMFYVSWDWHVKSVHAGNDAEWLMLLVNPWRLSLLFLISGVAIRFAADKGRPGKLMTSRIARLGLPILTGMVLIVAPQSWLQLVESGEFTGSFAEFYPRYLDFGSEFSIITPTWNHLWYVVYLLPYTLILVPMAGRVSRFMNGRGRRWSEALFSGRAGPLMALTLPVLPHVLIRLTLDPYFPTTHDFVWDWANHAHSFTMVVTGFVLARDDAFWGAIRRALPLAAIISLGLAALLTPLWANWAALEASGDWDWVIWPARIARMVYAWTVIVALLGLGQRYLCSKSRALNYMTEAIFPWYILHQTLIVMAGFWLTRQGLSAGIELALVITATIGGCAVLHELVIRRIAILRPLFGLKPKSGLQPVLQATD